MIVRFFLSLFRSHHTDFLRMFGIIFFVTFWLFVSESVTRSIEHTLLTESRVRLWGDIAIVSQTPPDDSFQELLSEIEKSFSLEMSRSISFNSTIAPLWGGKSFLSDVVLTDSRYPLVGEKPFLLDQEKPRIFVSKNFAKALGEKDMFQLSDYEFQINGFIPTRPWFWWFFTGGRSLWIDESFVEREKLLGLWSRVSYEYFFLWEDKEIQALKLFLETSPLIDARYEVRDIFSSQERITSILLEFQTYLQVFLISLFILSCISLIFIFQGFFEEQKKNFWLFMVLWFPLWKILFSLTLFFLLIFFIAFWAWITFWGFVLKYLASFPFFESWGISQVSIFRVFLLVWLMYVFWGCLSFTELTTTPILSLLRKKNSFATQREKWVFLLILSLWITVFSYIFLGNIVRTFLTLWVALIVFWGGILFFTLLFRSLFSLSKRYKDRFFLFYYTSRSLIRPGNMTFIIVFPLTIIFSLFYFFTTFSLVLSDATNDVWQDVSYYIFNIPWSATWEVSKVFWDIELYDILLARIIKINEKKLGEFLSERRDAWEFEREFNLTTHPLPDNPFSSWEKLTSWGISLDEDFAKRLWLKLWDNITFLLAGREVTFKVQNFRPALRDWFQAFFYIQLFPDDVTKLERSYFATLSESQSDGENIDTLLYNISSAIQVLDISETLWEVKKILKRVFQITVFLFLYFSFFILVMLSISLQILWEIRKPEIKILKVLGASSQFTRRFLRLEYMLLLCVAWLISLTAWASGSLFFFYDSNFFTLTFWYLFLAWVAIIVLLLSIFWWISWRYKK